MFSRFAWFFEVSVWVEGVIFSKDFLTPKPEQPVLLLMLQKSVEVGTRWAPRDLELWGPFNKWPYKWVTGIIGPYL